MKVKIYVEGGGDGKALRIKCREGFHKLFDRVGSGRRKPAITACGSRSSAFDDFTTAVGCSPADVYPLLLVDSESDVSKQPWDHLKDRDNWDRPDDAEDDQVHLMVQCMETWIVADRDAVKKFFGQDLLENALPPTVDLENRSKDDVQTALKNATKNCGNRRKYKKGKRSFGLLGKLDPEKLKDLPHFSRLCDVLNKKL